MAELKTILQRDLRAEERLTITNKRTKKTAQAVIWNNSNGGSRGDAHGRWDDGTASNGDWLVNDEITISGYVSIQTTLQTTQFLYDENRQRYQKIQNTYRNNIHTQIRTTYIGKSYEHISEGNKTTHKYFIYNADGKLIATHAKQQDSNPFSSATATVDKTNYLHYDNLGSIDTITDGQGNIIQQSEYKPFGEQYQVNDNPEPLLTNRGYTGHEHINEFGFIHMNGRVYDPTIGRFLSADPHIQAPLNTQSYNRYSYVVNNPLKYTDPSGYIFNKIWRGIKKAVKSIGRFIRKYARPIIAMAAAYYAGTWKFDQMIGSAKSAGVGISAAGNVTASTIAGQAAAQAAIAQATIAGSIVGGAAFGATNTILHGGSIKDAIKAGIYGALTGAVTGSISAQFGDTWNLKRVGATAMGAGINSTIMGGKFRDGFRMAVFTSSMRWLYNNNVDYDVDGRAATKGAVWKYKKDAESGGVMLPKKDGNDFGLAFYTSNKDKVGLLVTDAERAKHLAEIGSSGFFHEGGPVSKVANVIPSLNTTSDVHDTWVYWMGGQNASKLQNWGTMLPAYAVSAGATMGRYGIGTQLRVR